MKQSPNPRDQIGSQLGASRDSGSRRQSNSSRLIWYTAITVAATTAVVGLLRMFTIYWVGHFSKVYIPTLTLIALFGVTRFRRFSNLDWLERLLLFAIPLGAAMGILNGGIDALRFAVPHMTGAMYAYAVYSFSRKTSWDRSWLNRLLAWASYVILAAFAVVIGGFWIYQLTTGIPLRLGIGPGYLLLPLTYFMVKKKPILVLVTLAVLLLAGKRGPIVAVVAVISLFAVSSILRLRKRGLIIRLGAALAATLIAVGVILVVEQSAILTDVQIADRVIARWAYLNPTGDQYNLDIALSGRNLEIMISLREFAPKAWGWVLGAGYGWYYHFNWGIAGASTTNVLSHYVHLSPLNLVYLYGLPMAIGLLASMFAILARSFRVASASGDGDEMAILSYFWFGLFVVGLSGYSFVSDPFFWLVIGILSSVTSFGWMDRSGEHIAKSEDSEESRGYRGLDTGRYSSLRTTALRF